MFNMFLFSILSIKLKDFFKKFPLSNYPTNNKNTTIIMNTYKGNKFIEKEGTTRIV